MSVQVTITAQDMRQIAWTLVDLHGVQAIGVADQAANELDDEGCPESADAWRCLRAVVEDAIAGRLDRDADIILH